MAGQLNGGKLEDKGDPRDPYKWRGKMGIRTGPVPLQEWMRDGSYASGDNDDADDLHPELAGKK